MKKISRNGQFGIENEVRHRGNTAAFGNLPGLIRGAPLDFTKMRLD